MHFHHVLLFFFRKRKRKPQTCQTFTVTMLYKNPSANDGSRSFVLVISRMVLGFGGSTKLMTSERKHCSGQTHVTRHTRLQKDCLFIIQAFTTIRISWDMKEVLILFLFFGNIKADNTSLTTRQKLLKLGQEVLPHPPYLSNPATSDFRSLQNSLRGSRFSSDEAADQHLVQFFRRYRHELL